MVVLIYQEHLIYPPGCGCIDASDSYGFEYYVFPCFAKCTFNTEERAQGDFFVFQEFVHLS